MTTSIALSERLALAITTDDASGEYRLSKYVDPLTDSGITNAMKLAKTFFPELPPTFFAGLTIMVRDCKFTDKRLMDAVKHVAKNCVYPKPTAAEFLRFDRHVVAYTYDQIVNLQIHTFGSVAHPTVFDWYESVMLPGNLKRVWIHKNDLAEIFPDYEQIKNQ